MQRCINAMCPLGFDLESNDHSHKTKTAEVSSFLGKTSHITKTSLFKYIENFTNKIWKKNHKNSDIFHISAQNIDCGYSLEPPRRGGSNEYPQSMFLSRNKKIMYTPINPSFTI